MAEQMTDKPTSAEMLAALARLSEEAGMCFGAFLAHPTCTGKVYDRGPTLTCFANFDMRHARI